MNGFITGVPGIIQGLANVSKKIEAANKRALRNSGRRVMDRAIDYAPRSPTQKQINKHRKTNGDTSKQKNPRATSRADPGGLMRSIEFSSNTKEACIFVASNSEAGAYAEKIHDEKGKTWNNLGIGSIAKSAKHPVDDKFIERALKDSKDEIAVIFQTEHKKVKL